MTIDTGLDIEWRPFGWSVPRLLLVGLICALLLVVLVGATTSAAGFSPYNPNWDGNSEFRELADSRGELTVASNTDRYGSINPTTTVGFVFVPDRAYGSDDATRVRQFVEAGGTLVVADNYGPHGNALLDEIGATARFDGRILRDDRTNLGSPSLPVVGDTGDHRLVSGVDGLTLNYGTAVEPSAATPIINSSNVSYLVANDSETLDDDTELQSSPVVTVESVGSGEVIVVGDPSLFINSMLDESDNRQFVTALVSQRTHTLLDGSHTAATPPLVGATLALRSSPVLAGGVIAVLIGMIAAVGRQGSSILPWRQWLVDVQSRVTSTTSQRESIAVETGSLRTDPDVLKDRLREQHPNWDEDRLDRVIAGVLSTDTDSPDNE
jgi:hypothetical protein